MDDERREAVNPYRSPETCDSFEPIPVPSNPRAPLAATLLRRSWLYRRVHLAGPVEADVQWNGRGLFNVITVNGRKVKPRVTTNEHVFWSEIRYEFHLEALTDTFHVTVEVRQLFLPRVVVRIYVDGDVVYSEA